jgi:hypothetical protein
MPQTVEILSEWKARPRPLLFWNEFCQSTELDRSFFLWDSFIDISGLRQRQFDFIRAHITMVPFPERMDYLNFTAQTGVKEPRSSGVAGVLPRQRPDREVRRFTHAPRQRAALSFRPRP